MTLPIWETARPIGARTPAQIMADVKALHARNKKAEEDVAGWPPPERYATPTTDLPRGPMKIARLCDTWRASSARGPVGTSEPPGWRMADSIALRGEVGQRRFAALWLENPRPTTGGGKGYSMLFAFAHGISGRVSAAELVAYLTKDTLVDKVWLEQVGYLSRTIH